MIKNRYGQNSLEYLLLMVIIILAIVAFMAPAGLLTQGIDQSINGAVYGIEGILDNTW